MRFMIFVRATAESESESGPEPDDDGKLMAAMVDYHEQLSKAGVLLDASGLQPSAKGWRIRYAAGERRVIDGPFAEAKEMIGGFFLVDCASRDEAVAIAAECPAAEWCTVEVRAVAPCYEDAA